MQRNFRQQKTQFLFNPIGFIGAFLFLSGGFSLAALNPSDPSSRLGARSQALGTATVASQEVQHDSLFQNPAAPARTKIYALTVAYSNFGDSLSASVVDTKSSQMGGGLYYHRRDLSDIGASSDPALGSWKRMDEQIGFSLMGNPSDMVSIGLGGKYNMLNSKEKAVKSFSYWTADLGVLLTPVPQANFGFLIQNIWKDKEGLSPRIFVVGVESRSMKPFTVSLQGSFVETLKSETLDSQLPKPNEQSNFALGAAYTLNPVFVLRAGYALSSSWDSKVASAGFGYKLEQFEIDYAFRANMSPHNKQTHALSLVAMF